MGTDGLVLQHQGISSHSDESASMRFQLFKGWVVMEFYCYSQSQHDVDQMQVQHVLDFFVGEIQKAVLKGLIKPLIITQTKWISHV